MWSIRTKDHDKMSPHQSKSSPDLARPKVLKPRTHSAPTLNAMRLLEEDEGGSVLSRSRSHSSLRCPGGKLEAHTDRSIPLRSPRGLPGLSGMVSRRDSVDVASSLPTDPVSDHSNSSLESSDTESKDSSQKSKDKNLTKLDRETSSSTQAESTSARSGSLVSHDLPMLSESQPEVTSIQNIYEEQDKIKLAKGFSISPRLETSCDDDTSEGHQESSITVEELEGYVHQGAIPRQLSGELPVRLSPMKPRQESSPTRGSEHYSQISNLCEGDNRPVFLDVLRTNTDVIIITRKNNGEVTVFVLMPNQLKTDFINVYLLDGRTMKPLTSIYAIPPYSALRLSALVAELQDFLPTESIYLSEWAVIDREMAAASAHIFMQNPEIVPVTLFSLLADRLFPNTESMMYFFEHHYIAYREEQLALVRQQLNRDFIGPDEIAKIEGQIAGVVIKGPLSEEQNAHQEKHRKYIQTLKPPINIPPLPPRPQRKPSFNKPAEGDMRKLAAQPPTAAELAALQACYKRDGRLKVKSQPRQSELSDEDKTEEE